MGDASAVAVAAKWIASTLIEEGKCLYGVEDQVRALQRDLECMQEMLQQVDANPNLIKEDGQLRIFTKTIRGLAFRSEDVVDTYVADVGTKVYTKNLFLKLACLASHSYPIYMLRKEIEAIQQEIDEAKRRSENFRINMPNNSQQEGRNIGSSRPIPEDFIHLNDDVVGIEDDISKLVKHLTNLEDDFKVLAIVGTGGAGKTTLASQIYRHNKVQSLFPHRAFVSVSQQWRRIDLLRRIFKEVKGYSQKESSETELVKESSETELVRELHGFMKDKQCLVVLDDIWTKDAWDAISPIFPHTKGCRVILTTRIEEVPLNADNKCIIHEPQLLSEGQKWELFSKVAMEGRVGIDKEAEFEKLGKQMLEKCQGLPLAVVTLAGILRTKKQFYEWEEISKACTKNILKGKGGLNYGVVEDMLELSYLDLPTRLKPCFLYLAMYPEDFQIYSTEITQMWIAEGFIANDMQIGDELLEDVAMRLLNELAQRCILQVTERNHRGQIQEFRMHDLMREFCIDKAKKHDFLQTISSTCPYVRGPSQPRRISILSREDGRAPEIQHLRTLACFDATREYLESIHNKFKLLRVLSIRSEFSQSIRNGALPKQIGSLIHLTYLGLFYTDIRELPKSIRNLRNLLYFEFRSILDEVKVPNDLVRKMENLRGLVLPFDLKRNRGWYSISFNRRLGMSSGQQKKLNTLTCGAGTWMINELPALSLSLQNLEIDRIQTMEEVEVIYQCPSILEDRLSTLACYSFEDLKFDLEKLRDCTTLSDLHLRFQLANKYTGSSIQFPPNLVTLTLWYSRIGEDVDLMEVLGQLSKLKYLSLGEDAYLGTQLGCTGTAFPQLQQLNLQFLQNLEEWRMDERAMDRLNKIEIRYCEKLNRLPERIRSITTLKELEIRWMPEEFCRRLGYGYKEGESSLVVVGGGEDSYIIQHIPSVKVIARLP